MIARYQGVWGLSTDFLGFFFVLLVVFFCFSCYFCFLLTCHLGYFIPEDEWNIPKHDANPDNSDYEEVSFFFFAA